MTQMRTAAGITVQMSPVQIERQPIGWGMEQLLAQLDKRKRPLDFHITSTVDAAEKLLIRMQFHLIEDATLDIDIFLMSFDALNECRFGVENADFLN